MPFGVQAMKEYSHDAEARVIRDEEGVELVEDEVGVLVLTGEGKVRLMASRDAALEYVRGLHHATIYTPWVIRRPSDDNTSKAHNGDGGSRGEVEVDEG